MNTTPLIPDRIYHVYNHATGDDNFFRSDENYQYFLKKYKEHIAPIADTFAYCLLPNHFHFMVRIKNEKQLSESFKLSRNLRGFLHNEDLNLAGFISQQFSNLFNAYSKAYNKMYDRRGALFRERFNRKHVDTEEYYTQLIAYIHNNPVNHGFVETTENWTWSSYQAYLVNKPTELQKTEVLDWYGGEEQFFKYHNEDKNNSNVQDLRGFENLVGMNEMN